MNPGDVVDKTESGLQEVKTRALRLLPRLRSMLIMVDGRRTLSELQAAAAQVGAPADCVAQLLLHGLVTLRPAAPIGASLLARGGGAVGGASTKGAAPLPADPGERLRAAHKLMNDTVVDRLGVRAVFFTIKLERCFTREDLLALMPEYLRLLGKVGDADRQRTIEARLRDLLQ